MILLKFQDKPGELNMAVELKKPMFTEAIEKVLIQSYQKDIALRYSKALSDYIYEKMIYPKQGIYCTVNNVFWRYDEEHNSWLNTEMEVTDYVINQGSKLWNCFDNEFKYLKRVSQFITKSVQEESEKMFFTEKWTSVLYVDFGAGAYQFYESNEKGISKPIKDFFSDNRVDEMVFKVTKCLFNESNINPVLVMNDGVIKAGLLHNKTIKISSESIENVNKMLSYELEQRDALLLSRRIKNLSFYGLDYSFADVICREDDKVWINYYGVQLGIRAYTYNNLSYMDAYFKVDNKLLNQLNKFIIDASPTPGHYSSTTFTISNNVKMVVEFELAYKDKIITLGKNVTSNEKFPLIRIGTGYKIDNSILGSIIPVKTPNLLS